MQTINLKDLEPEAKGKILNILGLSGRKGGIIILDDFTKREYPLGSKKHFEDLILNDSQNLGLYITSIGYSSEFGTFSQTFESVDMEERGSTQLVNFLHGDHHYPTLQDLIVKIPFKILDDCIQQDTNAPRSSGLFIIICSPQDLKGDFDIPDDVIEAYFEDQIAMNKVTLRLALELYDISNPECTWEINEDQWATWITKNPNPTYHFYQWGLGANMDLNINPGKPKKIR